MALQGLQRIGREFLWVAVGQGASILGGLVGVRVLTQALPPSAYGELALAMTVVFLAQQTVLSPLSSASLRFFSAARDARELPAFFSGVRSLLTRAVGVLFFAACLLAIALWAGGQFHWMPTAGIAFGFALLSGCGTLLDSMQNSARERAVSLEKRGARRALARVRPGFSRGFAGQLRHRIPEFLASHIKDLIGFNAPTARGRRSCRIFSSRRARARCSRERTVPTGQPSTKAASA